MESNTRPRVLFDDMPETLANVLDELRFIKDEIREIRKADSQTKRKEKVPIGIERASELTGKAVTTLYRYTAQGLIPCYKKGKSIMFYEDEILEWVRDGRRESIEEKARMLGSDIIPIAPKTY